MIQKGTDPNCTILGPMPDYCGLGTSAGKDKGDHE